MVELHEEEVYGKEFVNAERRATKTSGREERKEAKEFRAIS